MGGESADLAAEIQVVYQSLINAADGLGAAKQVLHEAGSKSGALLDAAPAAGDAAVAGAITSFLGRWRYGASQLKSDTDTLQRALSAAGRLYQATDQAIQQAASKAEARGR